MRWLKYSLRCLPQEMMTTYDHVTIADDKQSTAEKSQEYRRAGAGGIDSPQASPEGSAAGEQPNQFAEKASEVYAKA